MVFFDDSFNCTDRVILDKLKGILQRNSNFINLFQITHSVHHKAMYKNIRTLIETVKSTVGKVCDD